MLANASFNPQAKQRQARELYRLEPLSLDQFMKTSKVSFQAFERYLERLIERERTKFKDN